MKRSFSLLISIFIPALAVAQIVGPVPSPFNSIRQNGVSTITAFGDTLWISPSLNRNIDNALEWYVPENADSVVNGKGRVYSLALGQDTVTAGLGYVDLNYIDNPQTAYGYYFSIDGGDTWRYEPHPLDPKGPKKCEQSLMEYDPECDIDVQYGGKTYHRIRFIVPQSSAPFSVSFKDNIVFSANFASGLLKSSDFGHTWERILLPPDNQDKMVPEEEYFWSSTFTNNRGEASLINRYDPVNELGLNLRAFGTLIDSNGNVWVGTGNGINISENALTAPSDSIRWVHRTSDGTSEGLLGNWVINIKEEPGTGRIWMTNRIISNGENRGLVYTEDKGKTFKQMLAGELINGIGFKGSHVFAVGDNGLFISPDGGDTWIKSPQIKSSNAFIRPNAEYFSVATTTDRVWIGTDDGMASTTDYGQTWEITRTNFPLKGGNVHNPEARNVDAYAYPNPFSPSVYEVVRIKFEVPESGNVQIKIYDFGMNLVREIENNSFSPGTYEAVWDGYDSKGRKVANGPYIYIIETGGKQINGKILVAD